VEEDSNKLFLS